MADYARTAEPFRSRKSWRLPWIVLGLLVALVIVFGAALRPGHITVAQGYLPANQEYGYGYDIWRLHEENSLGWRTDRPVRLMLWKAKKRPIFGEYFSIDGHLVRIPEGAGTRAFAIQPDYTLKRLNLSSREMDSVCDMIAEAAKVNRFAPGDLWRTRIEPQLQFVGSAADLHAPATAPADVPADAG